MEFDPIVLNRLRRAYDARPGRAITASYEILLEAFSSRTVNFAQIARQYGVTRKAVCAVYRDYFQALIGKTGAELRKARTGIKPADMTEAELRAEYARLANRRGKIKLTYDELLARFSEPGDDIAGIARTLGVTKETLWACYERYFRSVTGLSGTERFMGARRTEFAATVREIPNTMDALGVVARAAEKAGLVVQRMPKQDRHDVWSKALRIEGLLCKVHHLCGARSIARSTQRYVNVKFIRFPEVAYDAHIFYVDVTQETRRILVVPTYVIDALMGDRPCVEINIPVERRPVYHNHKPRVDWNRFEKEWRYLGDVHQIDDEPDEPQEEQQTA